MRAGGCALQQALTASAATVVKQAVVLAKRRGHAQVTPLHVATTMLSSSGGLFRSACQESHSHPLQCKALELCFNVALNRLPAAAATSSNHPMLGPHHSHQQQQHPSISNALVAAFKRAQAHQRRGSIENNQPPPPQQQQILAVKIELEQLIISILDDPSVSRVMREAGFSSTQVKTNVEKAVSLENSPPRPPPTSIKSKENSFLTLNPSSPSTSQNELKLFSKPITSVSETNKINQDLNVLIETLLMRRKRKSLVLVGESISNLENTVKSLMDRVDKGGVPDSLKKVKFITIPPLYSFCNLQREEVEQKIGELTVLVKSLLGKGVVLYLGDLKWISDYRVSLERERRYYCSVEHVIMELGRLVWGIGEVERFWLMGIATFQTYMRCRNGYMNSLETVWGLHPVTIPANTLCFSLVSESDDEQQIEARNRRSENRLSSSQLLNGEAKLSCCADCLERFEAEVRKLETSVCGNISEPTLANLPSWLQDERRRLSNNDQDCDAVRKLRKKWNTFCSSSAHKQPISFEGTLTFSFIPPSSSSDKPNPDLTRTHFGSSEPVYIQEHRDSGNPFSSNPSSTPNSASSSDIMDMVYTQKFKEFNTENFNIICNALEKKVPWQREIILEIAGTILQCRSGMLRRKNQLKELNTVKEETWLFFLGRDEAQAKERISRELAKIIFGSYSSFVTIGQSSFVSSDDCGKKRGRDEESCMSYMERFAREVSENPHRVFFLEGLDHADYCSKMGIKRAIGRGRLIGENGEDVDFCDAVIILSSERFSSRSTACSPSRKLKTENGGGGGGGEEVAGHGVSLDLNISFGDDETVDDQSDDDVGILENVDRRVVFKIQDL